MKFIIVLFSLLTFSLFSQEKISVYFDFNSSVLDQSQQLILNNLLKKEFIKIEKLVSYTDTFGTKKYNEILAQNRLNCVENYLLSKNLTTSSKEIIGENYSSQKSINNYKSWRKVDVFYSNEIVPEDKIIEEIKVVEVKTEDLPIIQKDTVSTEKFADLLESESDKVVTLDVKFFGGLDEMLPISYSEVEGFYQFLKENPSVKILIRGHVCCMDDYDLSVKRAKAIYKFLTNKGIDSKRLDYKGYSNSLPVAFPERTEEDMQKNRRVDVVILK